MPSIRNESVARLLKNESQDPRVLALFQSLYDQPLTVQRLAKSFSELVQKTRETRPAVWSSGDEQRMSDPLWLLDEVQYMGYVNFIGTEQGKGKFRILEKRLEYIVDELGATTLYALPFLKSPFGDAGFDVSDYREVDERFGGTESFRAFRRALAKRKGAFQMDLVFNHVSNEHAWAKSVLTGESTYHSHFHILTCPPDVLSVTKDATGLPLSAKYVMKDAKGRECVVEKRVVFPAFADPRHPHYTKVKTAEGENLWVLHTFYPFQWDLNYSHAPVMEEALQVLAYWVNEGADVLRLDAIPHLYKQMESDPRIMKVVELFRYFVAQTSPRTSLLVEANQAPAVVMKYFGDTTEIDVDGQKFATSSAAQLAYNFDQAIHAWASFLTEDKTFLLEGIERTPAAPPNTVWANFLRSHDELSLSKAPDKIREVIQKELIDTKRGVPFRGARGVGGRTANFLDHDPRRVNMAHAYLLSLQGHPILYYGDEILAKSDSEYARRAADERGADQYDSRDEGRGPIEASEFEAAVRGEGEGAKTFSFIKKAMAVRRERASLRRGHQLVIATDHASIVAYTRSLVGGESTLVILNLSGDRTSARIDLRLSSPKIKELLGEREVDVKIQGESFSVELAPYEALWLDV